MDKKHIILVTGANGGLGFELCRQLLDDPVYHILLGSRSVDKGTAAVNALLGEGKPGSLELLQLDVDDEESILAASRQVESKFQRLDTLVNNAGTATTEGSAAQQMTQNFATNAVGPYLVVEAFALLLRKARGIPRIINISSGRGSITKAKDVKPNSPLLKYPAYAVSKAAMNMVTMNQTVRYGAEGFKIFAYCPGFTISNLSAMNTSQSGAKPVSEGVAPMLKIIAGKRDVDHGKLIDENGEVPW